MYELWRVEREEEEGCRLEDAAGPILFWRTCDAEACFREENGDPKARCKAVPVTVGLALIEYGTESDLIELVSQPATGVAVVRRASARLERRRRGQSPAEPSLRSRGVRAERTA
jgi:hypothetical protein